MSKVALFIKIKSQPGKRDELRRTWEEQLKPRIETNAAQEVYFYCYDSGDENLLYLFELYSSREAFEASSQAPWFWSYMQATAPLLDGMPEVAVTTPLWTKGAP